MSTRPTSRGFATRPANPEHWIKAAEAPARDGSAAGFTARLTIDVTPELRGRIKIAAFRRSQTVADMLRDLLAREYPPDCRRRSVMMGNASSHVGDNTAPIADASDHLTRVELTWIEKRIENWIRFGRPTQEQILDSHRRVVSFQPGQIFAFVRWAANDFGTILSRVDIVRAIEPVEPYQTLPFVRPGGDILLKIEGWPKVEQVLRHIDAIESAGIPPQDVAPDHWRHVHNQLSVGEMPRLYTKARHQAWLKRQACEGLSPKRHEGSGGGATE